jgi:uncharacterized protein YdeI (YjbR/CyaY-like superfamily)
VSGPAAQYGAAAQARSLIEVPAEVVTGLIPLSAENRTAAGVAAGGQVDVGIEPDTAPREVEVPADLAEALAGDDAARATFDGLAFTHRKEWVRWVEEAKKLQTRATRVARTVESLRAGKRAR